MEYDEGGAQTKKGAVGDFAPFDSLTQTIPNDTATGFAMLTAAVPSHRARRLNIRPAAERTACLSFIEENGIDGRTELFNHRLNYRTN